MKTKVVSKDISREIFVFSTLIKVGDTVMVLAGGNSVKERGLKGKTGIVKKIFPKTSRVIVEGLNVIKKHKKAQNNQEESGIISKEASIHISNVMYFSKTHNRPFRLKVRRAIVDSGSDKAKVERGFVNPATKEFEAAV